MAKIIESEFSSRRIIKMSAEDVISIVKDYQRIVPLHSTERVARIYLNSKDIYIPEDV